MPPAGPSPNQTISSPNSQVQPGVIPNLSEIIKNEKPKTYLKGEADEKKEEIKKKPEIVKSNKTIVNVAVSSGLPMPPTLPKVDIITEKSSKKPETKNEELKSKENKKIDSNEELEVLYTQEIEKNKEKEPVTIIKKNIIESKEKSKEHQNYESVWDVNSPMKEEKQKSPEEKNIKNKVSPIKSKHVIVEQNSNIIDKKLKTEGKIDEEIRTDRIQKEIPKAENSDKNKLVTENKPNKDDFEENW